MVVMKIFERRNQAEDKNDFEGQIKKEKKSKPLKPILSLFSEKEASAFVKKLFANDCHQFNDFIKTLDELTDWQNTFQKIEEEFQRRNINSFQGEAKKFSDKVFKRFYPD